MLDLKVSTTIYIRLALGYKESKGEGTTLLWGEKKKSITKIVHKLLASLQLPLKLLQWLIAGFIQLPFFFLFFFSIFKIFISLTLQLLFRKKTNAEKKGNYQFEVTSNMDSSQFAYGRKNTAYTVLQSKWGNVFHKWSDRSQMFPLLRVGFGCCPKFLFFLFLIRFKDSFLLCSQRL